MTNFLLDNCVEGHQKLWRLQKVIIHENSSGCIQSYFQIVPCAQPVHFDASDQKRLIHCHPICPTVHLFTHSEYQLNKHGPVSLGIEIDLMRRRQQLKCDQTELSTLQFLAMLPVLPLRPCRPPACHRSCQ